MADAGEADETAFTKNLGQRERDELQGLCRGRSKKEIARELDLLGMTIILRVRTFYKKLNANNHTHAAMIGMDAGYSKPASVWWF